MCKKPASEAELNSIKPSLNQPFDGHPSPSAIMKQGATLDYCQTSLSSVHVTDMKEGPNSSMCLWMTTSMMQWATTWHEETGWKT